MADILARLNHTPRIEERMRASTPQRRGWTRSAFGIALAGLAAMGLIGAPSAAASTYITYHSNTIGPNTFIYTGLSTKDGNLMWANPGESIAIFLIDSSNNYFYYTYGSQTVIRYFSAATVKAACWNRMPTTIIATCQYRIP
jgi:hypothetical protein